MLSQYKLLQTTNSQKSLCAGVCAPGESAGVCVCVRVPGELHASRSRPGSRRRRGGSAGARSSPGLLPPPRCDTEESDHGCPCSPGRLPAPAESEEETVCVRGQLRVTNIQRRFSYKAKPKLSIQIVKFWYNCLLECVQLTLCCSSLAIATICC